MCLRLMVNIVCDICLGGGVGIPNKHDRRVNAGNMCPTKVRGTLFAHLNFQSINNKFDLFKIQVKE